VERRIYGLLRGLPDGGVRRAARAGEEGAQFLGADMSTKLKLMGVDVASIGDAHGATLNAALTTSIPTRRRVSTRGS